MKKRTKSAYRPRASGLKIPEVRLAQPRLPGRPRRSRVSAKPQGKAPDVEPTLKRQPADGKTAGIESRAAEPQESMRGDVLRLYLREVGQVQLLTPAEEIVLAKRIKRGDKAAREHMIKANLRLVVKIARDYEGMGVPLLDLINEGNIGLMKGVERFDPGKGAKLSTYAAWWIKQSIRRALANQSKTIRLPVHVVDKLAHMRRSEAQLHETLDREPSDEELAGEVNLTPRQVRRYRQASRAPVPLDAPLHEGETGTVFDTVADASAALPFERLVVDTDVNLVREVLTQLSPRESTILALRFGLEDGRPLTLEEIGEQFNLTRERIRQIQEQALLRMRRLMEERDKPQNKDKELAAA